MLVQKSWLEQLRKKDTASDKTHDWSWKDATLEKTELIFL